MPPQEQALVEAWYDSFEQDGAKLTDGILLADVTELRSRLQAAAPKAGHCCGGYLRQQPYYFLPWDWIITWYSKRTCCHCRNGTGDQPGHSIPQR